MQREGLVAPGAAGWGEQRQPPAADAGLDPLQGRRRQRVGLWPVLEVELLGDKGYQGAGGTLTSPHKGRKLTKVQKAHNRMVNSLRGPGERGFAVLKSWRIFTKVRCCPRRVGAIAKAVLALKLRTES